MNTESPSTNDESAVSEAQRITAPSPSQKEREAYAKVGMEILEKNMDPAWWAMALDHANGDHDLARSFYARWRSEELSLGIKDTANKKEDLDTRRVSSFNRIRQAPSTPAIPAALRPAYGALYWETLLTIGLMCSFVPMVLRFTALQPTQALLYTLFASISITVALRIGTRVVFKNKSGKIYRQLAAATACTLALASLLVGAVILKSGWDQDDSHNTYIQVVPDGEKIQTSSHDDTPASSDTENGIKIAY
jgi:hypothetical protein